MLDDGNRYTACLLPNLRPMTCAAWAQPGSSVSRDLNAVNGPRSPDKVHSRPSRHGSSARIVTIQDHAELLRGAIEAESVSFTETENRRSARIGAQTDDAQARCSTQQGVQRSRQAAPFEFYDEHFARTRIRIRAERWQVGPRRHERDRRTTRQRGPKNVLAQRRESGECDSDGAQRERL